jgi:hypothetical protein
MNRLLIAFLFAAVIFAQNRSTPLVILPSANDTETGELRLREKRANGSNYAGFKSPAALSANISWELPAADGTTGQCIKTNATGILSFGDCTSGSYQPLDSDLSAIAALSCSENQIIKRNGAGAWVCAADADSGATAMTQAVENSVANSVSVGVGTSGRAFAKTPVTIDPTTGAIASASTDPTSIEYKWQAGTLAAGASGKTNTGMSTAGVPVWRAYGGAEKTTMATDTVASDAQLAGVAALSATLTNKTLDVEGTGNSITTVQKVWFDAVNCTGTTASLNWDTIATLAPIAACSAGTTNTGLIRGLAAFADGTDVYQMQTHFALPSDWTGAIDLRFKWQTSAITGSVVWQAATVCVADAEVNDAAWNTASTVTDAAKGTTLQTNDASIAGLTTTGCAAGELLHLKIFRDPAHASDDLAAAANLIGVEVTTRRAQ